MKALEQLAVLEEWRIALEPYYKDPESVQGLEAAQAWWESIGENEFHPALESCSIGMSLLNSDCPFVDVNIYIVNNLVTNFRSLAHYMDMGSF